MCSTFSILQKTTQSAKSRLWALCLRVWMATWGAILKPGHCHLFLRRSSKYSILNLSVHHQRLPLYKAIRCDKYLQRKTGKSAFRHKRCGQEARIGFLRHDQIQSRDRGWCKKSQGWQLMTNLHMHCEQAVLKYIQTCFIHMPPTFSICLTCNSIYINLMCYLSYLSPSVSCRKRPCPQLEWMKYLWVSKQKSSSKTLPA